MHYLLLTGLIKRFRKLTYWISSDLHNHKESDDLCQCLSAYYVYYCYLKIYTLFNFIDPGEQCVAYCLCLCVNSELLLLFQTSHNTVGQSGIIYLLLEVCVIHANNTIIFCFLPNLKAVFIIFVTT